jgi:DNA/RNA endonuclease YhcR with UshA esterase domain
MCIFGSTQTGEVGDSVIITGKVTEYQTLTEVGTISYFYNYKTGTSPQPSEVTVSQINEMYEGMLVQVNNAQFVDGGTVVSDNNNSFSFSDGTGSMILFSRYGSRLAGHELPSGVVSIKGVVSQYQGEYQILVERIDDISAGVDNDPPVINLVSVLDSTNLIIDFNERIDITTAEDISHYSLNNNISVVAAFLYENTHVILTITGMKDGAHTLTVNGIEDEQGNILVNGTADFSYTAPVGIDSKNTTPVEIYPSPVHDGMLSVRSPKPFTTVSIYDIAGVKVMEWTGTEKMEISLDVGTLENGIFIMRITDHRGSAMVRKFVVNRK